MKLNISVLILNFVLTNIIRGFLLALLLAAAMFFVNGQHIGETKFFIWMLGGTVLSIILKFLEAVEIYDKLKGLQDGN